MLTNATPSWKTRDPVHVTSCTAFLVPDTLSYPFQIPHHTEHPGHSLQAMDAMAWTQHQPTCLALVGTSCLTICACASRDSLEKEPIAHLATILRTMETSISRFAKLVPLKCLQIKLVQKNVPTRQLAGAHRAANAWAKCVDAQSYKPGGTARFASFVVSGTWIAQSKAW